MSLFVTQNPATGETVEEFETVTADGLEQALAQAQTGFEAWREVSVSERADVLRAVAKAYDERADELARTVAVEMGKPVAEAAGELKLCSMIYAWYADNGPAMLEDEVLDVPGADSSVVRRTPVGVLLGIMPWNFPHYQIARFAAPNLLLGNAILLKHAPICARSSLQVEEIMRDAGVVAGAYQNLFADNDQIATVIADPRVQGVSLTGSERAGAAVAEIAGRNLKKVVLELGGSDPFIVLESADVDAVVKAASRARLGNAGQACNAPKRMLVADPVFDEFVDKLAASFEKITPGDPTDPDVRMGPLSSRSAADALLEQVDDAVEHGATVRAGGKAVEGPGAFVEPTVLTDVTPQMRAWSEELFGPVAVVYRVADADEAVALANDSSYGLSGSVWGADADAAQAVAERLDVGMAFVNEHGTTLPGLPFGGVKRSGFGRELGPWGLDEFANKKLVRVSKGR
ncbi:NAD-dependent succinate-semialdehyde dehydrogenase [Nocardioides mangrovicus]|uniref:NAD-dependent succinate-semialdehyde dehydrogenase n=1 Tax=Nocardioides mangrovicus TaxID=2478913 RepID=A0A3L8P6H3_9ACTN|nr:NAD-dependent succinate-semialdehyde dehydrogenase [Nocardioides mangrovicus]RLV50547.1 NAD-dependent succinate-semialdehyde dehydrogenase [Nocardioides mangrovicus]